jgi:hypothetical protein
MRAGIGAAITFIASEPGHITLKFTRVQIGRKVRGKCVRATSKNRSKRTCRRYTDAGTMTAAIIAGQNAVMFPAKVNGRALKPGPYRVSAYISDGAGNRSRLLSTQFAVLR